MSTVVVSLAWFVVGVGVVLLLFPGPMHVSVSGSAPRGIAGHDMTGQGGREGEWGCWHPACGDEKK